MLQGDRWELRKVDMDMAWHDTLHIRLYISFFGCKEFYNDCMTYQDELHLN